MTMTVSPLELAGPAVTGAWCAPWTPFYNLGPDNDLNVLRVADASVTVSWKEHQRYPWTRRPISRHTLAPGGDYRLVLDTRGIDVKVALDTDMDRGVVAVHYHGRLYVGSSAGWELMVAGDEYSSFASSLPEFHVPRGGIDFGYPL